MPKAVVVGVLIHNPKMPLSLLIHNVLSRASYIPFDFTTTITIG
jgi:hypothetical protein